MTASTVAVVVGGTRFRAPVEPGGSVRLGHRPDCDVHLPATLDVPPLTVALDDQVLTLTAGEARVQAAAGSGWTGLDVAGTSVLALVAPAGGAAVYDLTGRDEVVVGPQRAACVRVADPGLSFAARRRPEGGWAVSITGDGLFVDNVWRAAGRVDGGHLGFGAHDLLLVGDELQVDEGLVADARLPRRHRSALTPPDGYPDVRRSPRLVHRPPEDPIVIDAASTREDKRAGQLAKLIVPPVLMLAVTGGMAVMNGNPLMVLTSGVTSLVTVSFSVHGFLKDRRRAAQERAAQEAAYRAHLDRRAVEIHAARDRQRRGALYHHPDLAEISALASAHSPRVFEKTAQHHDFLHYRLGLGTVPASSAVDHPARDAAGAGTELEELAQHLGSTSATLDAMPIGADLVHGPVGYVGPRRLVIEQLQLLVHQLAYFHSYHDVQLIMVFPESERDDWSWMRWYRHSSLQDVNLRGFVYDQRSRDQVLSTLNQILKARRNARAEERGGRSTTFAPHYVVMILDETLVQDHVVAEFLREDPTDLGCSVVVVQETLSGLSDSVTTVVDVRDRESGVLVLEQGELVNTPFALDHLPAGFDPEHLPRTVGALRHVQDLRSSIPESVTFLELYGVERVDELGVTGRWAANSPHRTLGVPLGLRGPGDVVKLDLHEKAHGPHGLVAGTTGSGKSEIVQSYILSLAVNFHPHDVAFLLIDYKGGGMANLFADLPHLLGAITNLDGAQSMRALVSINAELKRRQRVFSEHGVNHVNQYQKLVKNGDATEPMPHLFLISDEFAELKSEQPEFMDELISTARIGRSLGIHLILATQKPSGVVNDQIWSNSKFKLALKVADKSDSMEIIKTPDAAEITLPGRSYLQVGNNEIYELFQSAWSGADYEPDKEDNHQEDHAIYAINDLGQYEILTHDLSGLDGAETVKEIPTELEAVVAGIREAALAAGITPVARPWLPPLPERIDVTGLHHPEFAACWQQPKAPLEPTVGRVDIPRMQTQETLRLELSKDGHLALFASPGYGKSTFLQTVVLDLARTHSPAHLHVYLLDFGTNGLLPLRGLPHVADTVTVDDAIKAEKLIARIRGEIRRRKQLLSEYAVASLDMYERASGRIEPYLLLVVDGFDGLKGAKGDEAVTDLLYAVAREGAGLGIHLLLTAGRHASLRNNLAANIKRQIALKLNDDGDARTIVGRTSLQVDDLPGRGMIKLDQPEIFQTALPAAGEDMLAIIEAIRAEAAQMDAHWQGVRPQPIPMVPDVLTLADLTGRRESTRLVAEGRLPVGLDCEAVQPVGLDPRKHRQLLVLGPDGESAATTVELLWRAGAEAFPGGPYVLDDQAGHLRGLADAARGRGRGRAGASQREVLEAALAELTDRQEGFRRAADGPNPPTQTDYVRSLDAALVLVADAATVVAETDAPAEDLVRLATEGPAYGMPLVLAGTFAVGGRGYDDFSKWVKTATAGIVIGKISDQQVFTVNNLGYKPRELGENEAYVVIDSKATRVKLPVSP